MTVRKSPLPAYLSIAHNDPIDIVADHRSMPVGPWATEAVEVANHCREFLFCLLVQVGDSNARGQDAKVRMARNHRGGHLRG